MLVPSAYAQDLQYGYAIFSSLKYPKDFKHFEYVNPDAPKGGIITQAHVGAIDSLNAFTLKGNKAPGLEWTYDTLLVASLDELNSYYPLLAESFYLSPNKDWVTFNIRKEALWHDNTPVTADDVAFSFDVLREKGNPTYQLMLKEVGDIKVVDKHTIRIQLLNNKDPALLAVIAQLPILSKAYFQTHDFSNTDDVPMLTSGPYRVKEYAPNRHVLYERVKNYWGRDLPVHKGYYNFDLMKFEAFLESVIAIEALKGGEIDFREENISKLWAKAYNSKAIKDGRLIKQLLPHESPPNLQASFINLRKPLLQDIHLRKALLDAFDFDWMNKFLFHGLYKRITSYYEGTQYQARGLPSPEELKILMPFKDAIPSTLFESEFVIPTTDANPNKNRNNLKNTKSMLEQVGYYYDGDSLISPITKLPVEIEIIYHFQGFERLFLAYKENLAKIGIKLSLRLLDYTQYQQRMQNFDFDIITGAFVPSTLPGAIDMQLWDSRSNVKGGLNLSGVDDKVVDYLIEKMLSVENKEDLINYARCLDRVLLWNYYTIPQMYSNNYRIVYWDKFGIPALRPKYSIGLETWWQKN